jgi:hypothetical protein
MPATASARAVAQRQGCRHRQERGRPARAREQRDQADGAHREGRAGERPRRYAQHARHPDRLAAGRPRLSGGEQDTTCGNWTKGSSAVVGHHDRMGLRDDDASKSWNSSHGTRGCDLDALKATGGNGLFYCFAANLSGCRRPCPLSRHVARGDGRRGSQIEPEIGGGLAGEVLEVGVEPCRGLGAAHVAQVRQELPVGVELAVDAEPCMKSSAAIEWISMRFMVPGATWPSSIRRVTKATARISRISEELKEISLTRLRISVAVLGTSGRASGLMCTTTTSPRRTRRSAGRAPGCP